MTCDNRACALSVEFSLRKSSSILLLKSGVSKVKCAILSSKRRHYENTFTNDFDDS